MSFCSLQTYFPKKGPKNLIKKRTDAVVNAKLRRSPFFLKKKFVRHPCHEEEELSPSFVRKLTFFGQNEEVGKYHYINGSRNYGHFFP